MIFSIAFLLTESLLEFDMYQTVLHTLPISKARVLVACRLRPGHRFSAAAASIIVYGLIDHPVHYEVDLLYIFVKSQITNLYIFRSTNF
jgi:hypothetical protein